MKRGYFALWRKIEDHPFYKEPREFSKLEAWIDLLINTQHKEAPQDVIIGMNILKSHYGESLKSIKTWSNRWMWSRSKVFRFLKLLKKMGQIDFKSETVTTRIIVNNFDAYDPRRNGSGLDVKWERNGSETRSNTDKNVKNVKNVNKSPPTPPKGSVSEKPKTWKSDFIIYLEQCERSYRELVNDIEWIADQERLNPNIDILLTMEKAKANYWGTQEAWKKKKRQKIQDINWKSTWQNALGMTMNRVFKDAVLRSRKNESQINNSMPECDLNSMTRYED